MSRSTKAALAVLFGLPTLMLAVWLIGGLSWFGVPLEIATIVGAVFGCRWMIANQPLRDGASVPSAELTDVAVPTVSAGMSFSLTVTVQWTSIDRALDRTAQSELARNAVLTRASRLAASWQPEQWELAGHEIGAALTARQPDASNRVIAWAITTHLELPEADRHHLGNLVDARREADLWRVRIAKEREVRKYLKEEVLSSADAAVVWWLSRNESSVERAVELADVLAKLSDIARGTGPAGVEDESVGRGLVEALHRVDPQSRRLLADEFAQLLTEAGLAADAGKVRRAFAVEDLGAQVIDIAQGGRVPPVVGPRDG
jgi:hypothetical protein